MQLQWLPREEQGLDSSCLPRFLLPPWNSGSMNTWKKREAFSKNACVPNRSMSSCTQRQGCLIHCLGHTCRGDKKQNISFKISEHSQQRNLPVYPHTLLWVVKTEIMALIHLFFWSVTPRSLQPLSHPRKGMLWRSGFSMTHRNFLHVCFGSWAKLNLLWYPCLDNSTSKQSSYCFHLTMFFIVSGCWNNTAKKLTSHALTMVAPDHTEIHDLRHSKGPKPQLSHVSINPQHLSGTHTCSC